MKIYLLLLAGLCFFSPDADAQILKRVADRAKKKVEQKAGDKVEKAIDEAVDGKQDTNEKGKSNALKDGDAEGGGSAGETVNEDEPVQEIGMKSYSKYDFVQGEKVIAYEDFSNAEIGDFPTRWNTNGSAEVVTINLKEGKWLRINNKGIFLAEFINNIPENSTLEFDLGVNSNFQWANGYFDVELTHFEDRNDFAHSTQSPMLHFQFHPMTGDNHTGSVRFQTGNADMHLSNEAHIKTWDPKKNLFIHVSIWRQGQRMRLYVNGVKLFDLPRAFQAGAKYTDFKMECHDMDTETGGYYLFGNLRLAEGKPDTRNKLVTEGKFVTSGISFDVNSDKIKPDSYGILKEIATVLNENPGMKIRIIGHTDSDGDEASNLELSRKRAASVKAMLSSEFGIDSSRMETDGMGESKAIADNGSVEGKAQNRRVEFVKL